MKYLVCNAGSTSLKFKLYEMPAQTVLASGKVERVRSLKDAIFHYTNALTGNSVRLDGQCVPSYETGIDLFLSYLQDAQLGALANLQELACVCFKTVLSKGFYGVHELTGEVLAGMETMMSVAPAHNGPYLEAIRAMQRLVPSAKLVGAFETGFHMTIPLENRLFGAPYEWYEKYGLMRMGYHGASHRYIAEMVAKVHPFEAENVISCHLGGSSSICAIKNGQSIDNSFGLSLQYGLIHAERVGEFDAFTIPYLQEQGLTQKEIFDQLCHNGGLKGISGVSGDLRTVQEAAEQGNERAALAIDVFCNGIVKTIGAFYAELGGLTALAFTGGIGENSALVRSRVCARLRHLGITLDEEANTVNAPVISSARSAVKVYVIPADEEKIVSDQAYKLLNKRG